MKEEDKQDMRLNEGGEPLQVDLVVNLRIATGGHAFDMDDLVGSVVHTLTRSRMRAELEDQVETEWAEVTEVEPLALSGEELYGLTTPEARSLVRLAVTLLEEDEMDPANRALVAKARPHVDAEDA